MRSWMILVATSVGLAALAGPAAAQTWVQCVARAPNGTLFVAEPSAGAERTQGATYRAEFIRAGRAAGGTEDEIRSEAAFCFTAASEAELSRLVAEAAKPCPTCQSAYTPKPVAWNIRDILPAELAASSAHLITLVMSQPPEPDPAAPAPSAEEGPRPAPPRPLASARWRTLLCGTEVRIAYGLETPADSPVESAPFRARALAPQGGETAIDAVLDKASSVPPSCASPAFVKLGELADFTRDLPPRGDERLAALKQRLDDVTVTPAFVETPSATQVATAPTPPPAPAMAKPVAPVPTPLPQNPPPPAVAQEVATQALNTEINRKNAEVGARNAAAAAAYEKQMDEFKAAQAAYERAQRAHEAEVARAAAERAAWEAKAKACNAGDRAACSQ